MTAFRVTLDWLNAATAAEVAAVLGDIFEDAPWIAEQAASARPFASVTALHGAMMRAVEAAPADRLIAFLCGHPELAGAAALQGAMGSHSTAEQASLGLSSASDHDLAGLNAAYRERFGFPFILCVRRHSRGSILSEFRRRLGNDAVAERRAALREVGRITLLRLVDRLEGPDMPKVHGMLSTHVLDTAASRPAAGVEIEVFEVERGGAPIARAATNAHGRTDHPLLSGAPLRIGVIELRFHVGAYFAASPSASTPPLLDVIPVRFAVHEPEGHYHIPLLVSPGAYSVYRGS